MTNDEKKAYAFILYTKERLEQKICAIRAGVTEKTMSKWVNEEEGKWKKARNRLLISKENLLDSLYAQMENLNSVIEDSANGCPDSKQADAQVKLTAAIRNMENDLAIADLVESGMRFIRHLQKISTHDKVMEVSELWNDFIQDSITKK